MSECNRPWWIPLGLSPLSRGVCSLEITIWNLLGNAFTQNTTSVPYWGHVITHNSEVIPESLGVTTHWQGELYGQEFWTPSNSLWSGGMHTNSVHGISKTSQYTISLSLCWFALLIMSWEMFLTCGVRRTSGYQLLVRFSSSHWPSAVSESFPLYENWNLWKSVQLKQLKYIRTWR